MKKKRNLTLAATVLNGITALIWIADVILRIFIGLEEPRQAVGFVLSIVCAILWCVSFGLNLCRYRTEQKEEKETKETKETENTTD